MYHEIEKLESEIVEFQRLITESSGILKQIEQNTSEIEVHQSQIQGIMTDIQQVKTGLDSCAKTISEIAQNQKDDIAQMHERKVEIEALKGKAKNVQILAFAALIVGLGGVALQFIL